MKVILLFGEMGSGKSHIGRELSDKLGFHFIEGDSLANCAMQEAIRNLKVIKLEWVDELVEAIDEAVLLAELLLIDGVVVSQALYRDKHRQLLIERWKARGWEVEARWVRTQTIQHIKQLKSRPEGWRWVGYWLLSKPWFEKPNHEYTTLYNRRNA